MNTAKLDPTEARTVQTFDQEAELQRRSDPPGSANDEALQFAFSLAPRNPAVLDIGCGYGRVIPYLQQFSPFRYTGIDPSIGMLTLGRQMHPQTDFRQIHLYALPHTFPEQRFDLALAITALTYVTPARMWEAFISIRRVLTPGGIGFFTFMNVNETVRFARNLPQSVDYQGPVSTLHGWKIGRIDPILAHAGFRIERGYCTKNTPLYSLIVRVV